MTELPDYVIKPNVTKVIVSQIIVTTVLAALFYLGIFINVSLLNIEIPGTINILIISVIALLVFIQALLSYLQTSKTTYSIYKDRLQIDEKYMMFSSIQEMKEKRNFIDRFFDTGTLIIGKTKVTAIPNFAQTIIYLKQMVQYSRTQYNQL